MKDKMWKVSKLTSITLAEKFVQRNEIVKAANTTLAQLIGLAKEEVGAPAAASYDIQSGVFLIAPDNPIFSKTGDMTLDELTRVAEALGLTPAGTKPDIRKMIEDLRDSVIKEE